jgi:hypothetical protein
LEEKVKAAREYVGNAKVEVIFSDERFNPEGYYSERIK